MKHKRKLTPQQRALRAKLAADLRLVQRVQRMARELHARIHALAAVGSAPTREDIAEATHQLDKLLCLRNSLTGWAAAVSIDEATTALSSLQSILADLSNPIGCQPCK